MKRRILRYLRGVSSALDPSDAYAFGTELNRAGHVDNLYGIETRG